MNIAICTLKSWNLDLAAELKKTRELQYDKVKIIDSPRYLSKEALDCFKPDYVFFPHWSYIIPEEIFSNFECVVFHMTDLPFGRGGSPLQNLIARGYTETKISAIRVEQGLDAGPIYMKSYLSLEGSAEEIFRRASKIIFHEMIPEILEKRPKPTPQQGEIVEFSRRTPNQSKIPADSNLQTFYDYIRMLDAEGYPKAFIEYGDFRLEFDEASYDGVRLKARVQITLGKEKNE